MKDSEQMYVIGTNELGDNAAKMYATSEEEMIKSKVPKKDISAEFDIKDLCKDCAAVMKKFDAFVAKNVLLCEEEFLTRDQMQGELFSS